MAARYSTGEIGSRLDIDRDTARGLIKFLLEAGVVEWKGERHPENGARGGPEKVYEFKEDYAKEVAEILSEANFI